jgi:DNA-binding transcriptional ArsR family regulator
VQQQIHRTFDALSDPTRLAIIERLKAGPATLTELGAPLDMTLPAVLKHVRILERNGLVVGRRVGRARQLRLRGAPLRNALRFLESYRAFWEGRLDSLGEYLKRTEPWE